MFVSAGTRRRAIAWGGFRRRSCGFGFGVEVVVVDVALMSWSVRWSGYARARELGMVYFVLQVKSGAWADFRDV